MAIIHPGSMPTPTSSPYGYSGTRPPIMTESRSSGVVADYTRGVIGITEHKQDAHGKTKDTTKDVCLWFDISSTYVLYVYGQPQSSGLLVQYVVSGIPGCSYIPTENGRCTKFHKFLSCIQKFPKASYAELDDVIGWAISKCPIKNELTLFDRQGFFGAPNGELTFAIPLAIQGLPPKLVVEGLRKRRHYSLNPMSETSEEIVTQFMCLCSRSPSTKLAGLYMVASLFLLFFPPEPTQNLAFLNFVVQSKIAEDKLTALLCTNDLSRYAVPELGMKPCKLEHELNQVYDGVAVAVDHCFADESAIVRESTKAILRAKDTGRKLIATISDKIGCVANRLDEGCCISVPVSGDPCPENVQTIRTISAKMEALVINLILRNQTAIHAAITNGMRSNNLLESDMVSEPASNTIALLTTVDGICRNLLHCDLMSKAELNELLNHFSDSTDLNRSMDELIVGDFARTLSTKIRNDVFSIIQKKNRLIVDIARKPVILYNERLYITQDLMSEILSDMTKTQNRRNLINALKRCDILNATDGNTHPIDVHDITGKPDRLYCYDISAHILDADVQETLSNPDAAKLFIRPDQLPEEDFLPLVSRSDGRIAGRQIKYSASTNNSMAIWGQSGYGKTYLMMQLMLRVANLHHRVVAFDSSDSFSLEALYQTLPKNFVDTHIEVYDLDRLAIPVDLFRIDRSKSLEAQEEMVLDSICIRITELTSQQENLLSSSVHDVLEIQNPDEPVSLEDIRTMLDEKSPAYQGVMSKLQPLLRMIRQRGMANRSWKDFLTKDITIIRVDASITKNGNVLFDLLIASLYNAQCEDPAIPLEVFVDELQCQNLSEGSPIHKLLTEGRKKHISFYGATQDFYSRSTEIGKVMGKVDTQIFLKPTLNSAKAVASELKFKEADLERLDNMVRGECYIKGSIYNPETGRNEAAVIRGTVSQVADPGVTPLGVPGFDDNAYSQLRQELDSICQDILTKAGVTPSEIPCFNDNTYSRFYQVPDSSCQDILTEAKECFYEL